MKKNIMKKKAISPVVTTVLLIIVVVIAVAGFNNWFNNYQSKLFSNIEKKDAYNSGLNLLGIIGNTLYIKSNLNFFITDIKINDKDCNISKNLTKGINEINISSCLKNLTQNPVDIVVFLKDKIIEKKIYLKNKDTVLIKNSSLKNTSDSNKVYKILS